VGIVLVKMSSKGLVILYTGEGKGKTTAALGLALRASGYDKKVLIIQFGKNSFSGELEGIKKLDPLVKIIQGGKGFVGIREDKIPLKDHQQKAQETYEYIYKEVISGKWNIIVADEIVGAVASKLLSLSQVLKLIEDKPESLDLVLTGHHACPELIEASDLVTEMKAIKHPFEKGVLAKVGIDY